MKRFLDSSTKGLWDISPRFASKGGRASVRQRTFHPDDMKINNWNGGRGVYFRDPNGHLLELLTRDYSAATMANSDSPPAASKL
jgi:catechol 2,3-dioxygenase-like lactoylglutathione lyase family enzyme